MPTNVPAPDPAGAAEASDRKVVSQLQRSAVFRDYQKAFETTTGLPLALRPTGSFQFPLHGSRRANPFCTLLSGNNQTCAACLQLQQRVEQGAVFRTRTMKCFAGLNETAVPVRVGARVIGYLQTGQVLLLPPTAARFRALHRRLAGMSQTPVLPALRAAYFRTRVMSRRQYAAVVRLLEFFAQHLASLSNQIMLQGAMVQNPEIACVKTYMAEHQGESLKLQRVAREIHRSTYYFCRLFKRDTGLTFTDYLARLRVGSSKVLLGNARLRISEVAFATGFQSLSQFNRSFRRIEGVAPSAYRASLQLQSAAPVRCLARSA